MESKLTIDEDGNKRWELPNGFLHREDGPVVESFKGDKFWYLNNKRHRENGPAIEWVCDDKCWYLNGIEYTEKEYKIKIRSMKLTKILK
jgi:transposase